MKWRAHIIMDLDFDAVLAEDNPEGKTPAWTAEQIAEQVARLDSDDFAGDILEGLDEFLGDDTVTFTVVRTERVD